MILLDNTHTLFENAVHVIGLTRHYRPANIMITRTTGDVGSLDRLPVRLRIEKGGYILMAVLPIKKIDEWFDNRLEFTSTLTSYNSLQSWIVISGVVEDNLFGTVGESKIQADELKQWLTESRLTGCTVTTVSDILDLSKLCFTINDVMVNNGEVLGTYSIETILSAIPHVGPIAHSVTEYTGSVWAALAMISNRDLFKTLPLNPKAREALGPDFTREHHKTVRSFLGLEPEDYGLGLYIDKE